MPNPNGSWWLRTLLSMLNWLIQRLLNHYNGNTIAVRHDVSEAMGRIFNPGRID